MTVSFTWLGHSTFLIEADGHRLIIDPFITSNPLIDMSVDDIDVELIIITHAHGDHVGYTNSSPAGDTIAIAQRTGAKLICNFEIGNWLMAHGVKQEQVVQGNTGGTIRSEWIDVKFTKAFHSSSFGDGSYGGQPGGFVIHADGLAIYHSGDTDLFGDMALIGGDGLDLAFLPIGDVYTMGIDDSIKAIKMLRPQYVFPIHYNTFPPIVQDAKAWAERVNRETDAQPIVIDPGSSYTME